MANLPDFDLVRILKMVIPVLLALTVHEFAHAWAADKLGDNTAKNEGRLTMNPLAHLDPIGTLMLFFSGLFGWAKPVPFNPRNFKNPARDSTLVALAGPLSNILLAVSLYILFEIFIGIGFFGWLPVSREMLSTIVEIFRLSIWVNIAIAVFNMLPAPPLDGFKVFSYFLPHRWVVAAYQNQMVFFIALLILLATGTLGRVIRPIINGIYKFLVG